MSHRPKLGELLLEANDSRKDLNFPDLIVLHFPFAISMGHHSDDQIQLRRHGWSGNSRVVYAGRL